MARLTEEFLALLNEIEETAQGCCLVLGEDQMSHIISYVASFRDGKVVDPRTFSVFFALELRRISELNIGPKKIRELLKTREYFILDQTAKCLIKFDELLKLWLNLVGEHKLYVVEKSGADLRFNSSATGGFCIK